MQISKKSPSAFLNTVMGHGWYQLAPFEYDEECGLLAFAVETGDAVYDISISGSGSALGIAEGQNQADCREDVLRCVKHILRLDEPFEDFYGHVGDDDEYSWIRDEGYGPLLRSPSVFEDLVKTICTTNCSWALTKTMVANLVSKLGTAASSGRKAFPTPERVAGASEEFFSKEIRAGYRGPYILEFAEAAASGSIDPESWFGSELSSGELIKEIKKVKGVGDYAAEHMLKLLGRYDGLALDSFLRSEFYKTYNRGKKCPDKRIERHYSRFGAWKGLVIWFDMVEKRASTA